MNMNVIEIENRCFRHLYPVWGDVADWLVYSKVEEDDEFFYEQLHVRRHQSDLAEVACIPAYLRGVSLGDLVRLSGQLVVEVERSSGRFVFRAWSEDGWDQKHEILHSLAGTGALMETCTERLLAIDAENEKVAENIRTLLDSFEESSQLEYETGWD